MKIRTFFATAAAATIGTSSLLAPAVNAATVEFEGSYCKITITDLEITEMRKAVVNSDPGAEQRVKDAFPGLEKELDILLGEVETQFLTNVAVDSKLFSPQGQQALNAYMADGFDQGYTEADLILILVAPAIPDLLGGYFDENGETLVGSQFLTKSMARQQIIQIDNYGKASGFDSSGDRFLGLQASPKASAIVSPALETMTVFADQVKQPFQACVDAKAIPGDGDASPGEEGNGDGDGNGSGDGGPGGDGNNDGDTPGGNGDATPGGNPDGTNSGTGNQAGRGGSSFGSS